jgi:ABC-2 type transport system ATP-binding protein
MLAGIALAGLSACGDSISIGPGGNPGAEVPETRPDFGGVRNASCDVTGRTMPGAPPVGESRDGLICRISISSPINPADEVVFQVFEPSTLTGGQFYPLVLEGHGFGSSRQTDDGGSGMSGLSSPIGLLRDAGYGVISIDQAGHGESDGTIRIMDPDQEGRMLVAIVDWLEINLDWYAIGPDLAAGMNNMVLGAVGSSYGGGYQHVLHAVDPKQRLDALVPQITWNDLTDSLNPGGVIKALWASILFGVGNVAGGGGNLDPFVTSTYVGGLAANRIDEFGQDFFRYHGPGYFCDGIPVATNGGAGTTPSQAPIRPGPVHVLYFQGFRDTLFNFTEAQRNFECYRQLGGDVRLLSYQAGHNSLQLVPDPVALISQPQGAVDFSCGDISADVATIAWFDEYLKGIPGAANAVLGTEPICLSLSPGDAVRAQTVMVGGTTFTVPETRTLAGVNRVRVIAPLYTAEADGEVLAGVPTVDITLEANMPDLLMDPENVIVFVGTGRSRNGIWELADNQVQPLRGIGRHQVDLPGIGERLSAGDEVGLLLFGLHEQYLITGGVNVADPVIASVRISGSTSLPLLGVQP